MRIRLDRALCTGHGRCYTLAPQVFTADDDGYCEDPAGEVALQQEAAARVAVESCPEGAITIIDA